MFATNPIEGAEAIFAYDVVGNHIVDSRWVAEDLRRSIARKYSLRSSTDAFQWAHSAEAGEWFYARINKNRGQ
jgi:hypothetical protein